MTPQDTKLRDRIVAFLLNRPCRCSYLGDGDWIECERCLLLEDMAAEANAGGASTSTAAQAQGGSTASEAFSAPLK